MAKYVAEISGLLQSSIQSAMASYNHIPLFWVNITGFCFSSLLLVRFYSIQTKGVLLKEEIVCGIAECWKNHRLQTKKQITCGSFLRLQ